MMQACFLLHVEFLLGLLFNPEDGGDMFLLNVYQLSPGYMTLCPRGRNSLIIRKF
jgi:hypothetical protein